MFDRSPPERGEPIDRPASYRTLVIAFLVWSAHFTLSYGALLVFPETTIARVVAIFSGVIALAALLWQGRKLSRPYSAMALGALGLAAAGVVFGTFPAIIG